MWRFFKMHLCACAGRVFAIRPHTDDARIIVPLLSKKRTLLSMILNLGSVNTKIVDKPGGRPRGRKCLLHD